MGMWPGSKQGPGDASRGNDGHVTQDREQNF